MGTIVHWSQAGMSLVSGKSWIIMAAGTTTASATDSTPARPMLETRARMAGARLAPSRLSGGTPGRPERARMWRMPLPGSPPEVAVTAFDRDLCVIGGGGHVGLPLALLCADSGLRTVIYDVDAGKVDRIRSGRMPFREE